MRPAVLILALALAACGADGPPEPPARTAPPSGISFSGDARIGLTFQSP
jgi:predicted small lipoprotein YifL